MTISSGGQLGGPRLGVQVDAQAVVVDAAAVVAAHGHVVDAGLQVDGHLRADGAVGVVVGGQRVAAEQDLQRGIPHAVAAALGVGHAQADGAGLGQAQDAARRAARPEARPLEGAPRAHVLGAAGQLELVDGHRRAAARVVVEAVDVPQLHGELVAGRVVGLAGAEALRARRLAGDGLEAVVPLGRPEADPALAVEAAHEGELRVGREGGQVPTQARRLPAVGVEGVGRPGQEVRPVAGRVGDGPVGQLAARQVERDAGRRLAAAAVLHRQLDPARPPGPAAEAGGVLLGVQGLAVHAPGVPQGVAIVVAGARHQAR
ncbi:MAG: hypothetical protein KC549_12710, partial [Myxococcales bacterium]|nr:hypothetical protein [Myxococcales bacterium]